MSASVAAAQRWPGCVSLGGHTPVVTTVVPSIYVSALVAVASMCQPW